MCVMSFAVSEALGTFLGKSFKYITTCARYFLLTFFAVSIQAVVLYSFRKYHRFHKIVQSVILCFSVCVFAVDLFTVYNFRLAFNPLMADIISMTNPREGKEFLYTYLADYKFWLFVVSVLCVILLLWRIYSVCLKRRRLAITLFILCFTAGSLVAVRDVTVNTGTFTLRLMQSNAVSRVLQVIQQSYRSRRDYQNMLNTAPAEAGITHNASSIPYVVFILGEAVNRNHMSIYGYNLPTTPLLSELNDTGKLYVFSDVISPEAHTNAVLEKLFTFFRYDSAGVWYTYTNLFTILKEAGYFTVWLSNQEAPSGVSSLRLYSSECNIRTFTNGLRDNWDEGVIYDGLLIPMLDDILHKEHHAKNFYVLHLIGTHVKYTHRYPSEWTKFTAQDENGSSYSRRQCRAEYDNAVLYNDFVVSEIIKRFEDKNAIVIYVSDHGEEVYDSIDFSGHGTGILSRNIHEIPMLVWVSQKFSASYHELEKRIAASVDRPYMTDDMIHTLLDIMSIETPEYEPSQSIINADFDESRPRIYSGHIYDKENGFHALP